jgi:hypothetical protein
VIGSSKAEKTFALRVLPDTQWALAEVQTGGIRASIFKKSQIVKNTK